MGGQYRVILADPPWAYRVFDAKGGQGMARSHYDTVRAEDMRTWPIASLAAKDCALFMWATMPCLPEAFDLMRAWGFTYRTVAFTWVKVTRAGSPVVGLGHYTRGNAEVCLLGVRGRMARKAADVSQVLVTQRREHSRKPDEQYARIMRLFDGPYLELFARQQWPGWDVWGNQAAKFPAQPFLFDTEEVA